MEYACLSADVLQAAIEAGEYVLNYITGDTISLIDKLSVPHLFFFDYTSGLYCTVIGELS